MRAHEAGALHAEAMLTAQTAPSAPSAPSWLGRPLDPNHLVQALWPAGVQRSATGHLTVEGLDVRELAATYGTPAYVLVEDDFRARCRAIKKAMEPSSTDPQDRGGFAYYAGKAFLSIATARWVHEEGLSLDVCTGGELAVALRAGFPVERIGSHGNNKSVAEIERALTAGVRRFVVDSRIEIDRLAAAARAIGVRPGVLVRVNVGVEANTHEYIATAREDQKFGFALADGVAERAIAAVSAKPSLALVGLHSRVGSQIFDMPRSTCRPAGSSRCTRASRTTPTTRSSGSVAASASPTRCTTTRRPDDPTPVAEVVGVIRATVVDACRVAGLAGPRISIEPGRAIVGPAAFTLYEVGTVKPVRLDGGGLRTYVSVDGGMSDNIRPALYGAAYSATLASRSSDAGSRGRQAL